MKKNQRGYRYWNKNMLNGTDLIYGLSLQYSETSQQIPDECSCSIYSQKAECHITGLPLGHWGGSISLFISLASLKGDLLQWERRR